MKKFLIGFGAAVCAMVVIGAMIDYRALNTTQFGTNLNIVSIKSAASVTNLHAIDTLELAPGDTIALGDGAFGGPTMLEIYQNNSTSYFGFGDGGSGSTFDWVIGSLTAPGGQSKLMRLNGAGLLQVRDVAITNTLKFVAGAGAGKILQSDANGAASWTAAAGSTNTTLVTSNITTYDITVNSNIYFLNGKGSTLIVTQYVRFPWTTLSITGTNVSTLNLTSNSFFKLALTTNAFIGAPTDLPGTNLAQTIQIAVQQDSTGARTLTLTNSAWVISGSGESTNAVPSITTNANAVSILTFVTSPFNAAKLYGVNTPFVP